MVREITEREHAEAALRLSQEQGLVAQRRRQIEQLAGRIGRVRSNFLGVVIGTADLVESEAGIWKQ